MNIMYRVRVSLAAFLVGLLLSTPLHAQTATTSTTLSAAVTSTTATQITVSSATGFTAATTVAYVDRELMNVTAVSGTTITVLRGGGRTAATTHLAGAVVYVSLPTTFVSVDPWGSCTATNYTYLPIINYATGQSWYCNAVTNGTVGYWGGYGIGVEAENRAPQTALILAGTTQTLKLTDVVVGILTTSTGSGGTAGPVTTLVLPTVTAGVTGKRIVISDFAGGLTATTYVGLSGTVDGAANAVLATLKTAFQSMTLMAGTNGWIITSCFKCGPN